MAQCELRLRAQWRTSLNVIGKGAVFGPPAAAAAVSKLLGLSPEEIEDAFGTACTQACGLTAARYESMAKRMQHGFAARNGLFAALMSRESYTGIDKVFERPHGGFLSTFGNGSNHEEHYLPAKLTDGLGGDWKGMSGMRVKPYASQISTHAPINCIEVLQGQYPERFASLDSIQKITIRLAEAPYAHGGMSPHLHSQNPPTDQPAGHQVRRPLTALGAQMSTRYTVAAQLVDGSVLMDQFNSAKLDRADLWKLVDKVDCVWDRGFDRLSAWHTRVTVDFGKGYTVSHEVSGPRTYDDPLSNEGIRGKWSMLADSVLSAGRKAQIEEIVLNMESLDDISQLIRLLETEVKNPIE